MKCLRSLHNDQQATAMTEFVIMLPIFTAIFVGIFHLGSIQRSAGQVTIDAYAGMWELVAEDRLAENSPHAQLQQASEQSVGHVTARRSMQTNASVQTRTADQDEAAFRRMANGHWHESESRTGRISTQVQFRHVGQKRTSNPQTIVGESQYARRVVTHANGDDLSRATGARYGTVDSFVSRPERLGIIDTNVEAHFHTLVQPVGASADIGTETTTRALEGIGAYDNLLGIAFEQPLRPDTLTIPSLTEEER